MPRFNKANTAAAVARRKAQAVKKGHVEIAKWHTIGGHLMKHPLQKLAIDATGVLATLAGKPNPAAPRILTLADFTAIAQAIDTLAVGANHLNVKKDPVWQQAYRYKLRNMTFKDAAGGKSLKAVRTVPCHNCGLILPWSMIQVDHHMPQAGSADFWALKVARALGLTVAPPTGSKGVMLQNQGTLQGLTILPKGRAMGDYSHFANASDLQKWTLNERGMAFFSLVAAFSMDALESVRRRCMNTILNLVPLCGECNRVKSDKVKAFV